MGKEKAYKTNKFVRSNRNPQIKPKELVSRGWIIELNELSNLQRYFSINRWGVDDVKIWKQEGKFYLIRRQSRKKRLYLDKISSYGHVLITRDGTQTDLWMKDHKIRYKNLPTYGQWRKNGLTKETSPLKVSSSEEQAEDFCIEVIRSTIAQYPNIAPKLLNVIHSSFIVQLQEIPERMLMESKRKNSNISDCKLFIIKFFTSQKRDLVAILLIHDLIQNI